MVGFVQQNFLSTFYGCAAGVVISVVLCVPDWPMYNRDPVSWLPEYPKIPDDYGKPKSSKESKEPKEGKESKEPKEGGGKKDKEGSSGKSASGSGSKTKQKKKSS